MRGANGRQEKRQFFLLRVAVQSQGSIGSDDDPTDSFVLYADLIQLCRRLQLPMILMILMIPMILMILMIPMILMILISYVGAMICSSGAALMI
jgi:hypothetical protein